MASSSSSSLPGSDVIDVGRLLLLLLWLLLDDVVDQDGEEEETTQDQEREAMKRTPLGIKRMLKKMRMRERGTEIRRLENEEKI